MRQFFLLTGKDSGELTAAGAAYGRNFADYLKNEQERELVDRGKDILVLTGTSNLHYKSTKALQDKGFLVHHTPVLNELRGGDYHGLTKDQMKVH